MCRWRCAGRGAGADRAKRGGQDDAAEDIVADYAADDGLGGDSWAGAELAGGGDGVSPELTGRENTYLERGDPGDGQAGDCRKFDEIVAFAEMEKFIDTPVKRYSSGMYVRLAFAVAAHLEPEILLVDEVLAVGDIAFPEEVPGQDGRRGATGRTIILVSHNINAISVLCRSAILLEKGRVAFHSDKVTDEVLCCDASPPISAHTIDLSHHPNRTSGTAVFEEISYNRSRSRCDTLRAAGRKCSDSSQGKAARRSPKPWRGEHRRHKLSRRARLRHWHTRRRLYAIPVLLKRGPCDHSGAFHRSSVEGGENSSLDIGFYGSGRIRSMKFTAALPWRY